MRAGKRSPPCACISQPLLDPQPPRIFQVRDAHFAAGRLFSCRNPGAAWRLYEDAAPAGPFCCNERHWQALVREPLGT